MRVFLVFGLVPLNLLLAQTAPLVTSPIGPFLDGALPSTGSELAQAAPKTLSATGAFSDLSVLEARDGLLSYGVNSPLWSDGAQKRRWMAIPNDGFPDTPEERIGFSEVGPWRFPIGSVFIKHFEWETLALPGERKWRPLETRFLVHGLDGQYYGLCYRWRPDGSDADLFLEGGSAEIALRSADGTTQVALWSYPSVEDCAACHNPTAGIVLGVRTHQLNGDHPPREGAPPINQLRRLNRLHFLSEPFVESDLSEYGRCVPIGDVTAPLEDRVRSYLAANCAHCHQPGVTNAHFDVRYHVPLESSGLIDGPVLFDLGIADAHVIAPGRPEASLSRLRMAVTGELQMPPMGRNQVDQVAVDALTAWINELEHSNVANPVAVDDQDNTAFNTAVTLYPLANDRGSGLTIAAVVEAPRHGQVTLASARLSMSYRPDEGFHGSDSFTYQVENDVGMLSQPATVTILTAAAEASTELRFVDRSSWLPEGPTHGGVAMAVVDMDADGRDDIVHFDEAKELMIDYQSSEEGSFSRRVLGTYGDSAAWSLAVADVDHNGRVDLLFGGYRAGMWLLRDDGAGDYESFELPESLIFVQGSNFADINGDGWLDAFVCNDLGENLSYRNNRSGNFVLDPSLIDTTTAVPSDNSGNYGSVWADYDGDGDLDLYISKCRSSAPSPSDPRRINLLLRNDGPEGYREVGAFAGLADGAQSWATDFADIDNDGDLDAFVGNHGGLSQLYLNQGGGRFTEETASRGISVGFNVIQCLFRDLNNDGWLDLFITGALSRLYLNQGGGVFAEVSNVFPGGHIESCAIGDLNHDGFLDIFAGYAELYNIPSAKPDRLWINEGNGNGFLAVTLEGSASNRSAIGARLELEGSWGIQVREVRAGESYGITNSLTKVFGLGNDAQPERLVIRWPSGTVDELYRPTPNQFLRLREGFSAGSGGVSLAEWQASTPGAGETPSSNEDGDAYDDLLEYALGGDPQSGSQVGLGLQLGESPAGGLRVSYVRPSDRVGVEYQLEQSADGQTWSALLAAPPQPQGEDLERIEVPLGESSPRGFVRLEVSHEMTGETRFTPPVAWTETAFQTGYQSHGVSLSKAPVYQSTVRARGETTLTLAATGLDLRHDEAYYLEILEGEYEGHRFDLVSHDGRIVVLDLEGDRSTMETLPHDLDGVRVAIKPHWTLREVYRPEVFQAGRDLSDSDQILFFSDGRFESVFLLNAPEESPAKWIATGDVMLTDQGHRILSPGMGRIVHLDETSSPVIRLLGQVETHHRRVILRPGYQLITGVHPIDMSPGRLGLTAESGFTAHSDPAKADRIDVWRGDRIAHANGYDSYFLFHHGGQAPFWTDASDTHLPNESESFLLGADRAIFLQLQPDSPGYLSVPWPEAR